MKTNTNSLVEITTIELANVTGGDFKGFGVEIKNDFLSRSACGAAALGQLKLMQPNATPEQAINYAMGLCNGATSLPQSDKK